METLFDVLGVLLIAVGSVTLWFNALVYVTQKEEKAWYEWTIHYPGRHADWYRRRFVRWNRLWFVLGGERVSRHGWLPRWEDPLLFPRRTDDEDE